MNKLIKKIKNILVGDKQPKDKYSLWLDTSNGESNAVLKYKGHAIAGGGNNEPSDPGYYVPVITLDYNKLPKDGESNTNIYTLEEIEALGVTVDNMRVWQAGEKPLPIIQVKNKPQNGWPEQTYAFNLPVTMCMVTEDSNNGAVYANLYFTNTKYDNAQWWELDSGYAGMIRIYKESANSDWSLELGFSQYT